MGKYDGCDFCLKSMMINNEDGIMYIDKESNELVATFVGMEIAMDIEYCPCCGEGLE